MTCMKTYVPMSTQSPCRRRRSANIRKTTGTRPTPAAPADTRRRYEVFARQQKVDLGPRRDVRHGDFDDLYDEGEAKKDQEHEQYRHKITEDVAATEEVGAGGYAFPEHHEENKDAEEASGETKHRHLFG
ncbi:hypothetical protein EJB05_29255, partial [Eragrostis curvula]